MKTTARRSECLPSSRCFFYLCKSQCAGCTCNSAVVNSVLALLTVTRTFISGFFGMNTAKIHDTEAGQSLYWMIAIPVTVTVLALAFVYWYKGDEIGDWIHDKTHDTDRRQWKSTINAEGNHRPIGRYPDKMACNGADTKELWKAVKNSVRYWAREGGPEVMRQSTFHSDIAIIVHLLYTRQYEHISSVCEPLLFKNHPKSSSERSSRRSLARVAFMEDLGCYCEIAPNPAVNKLLRSIRR